MMLLCESSDIVFISKFIPRCQHAAPRMWKEGRACQPPWLLWITLNLLEMKGSESTDGIDWSFEWIERATLLANRDLCGEGDS